MQLGVCAAKFITHAKNINNELGNFQALTHSIFAVTSGILRNLVDALRNLLIHIQQLDSQYS